MKCRVIYDNGLLSLRLAELHFFSLSLPEPFAIRVSQRILIVAISGESIADIVKAFILFPISCSRVHLTVRARFLLRFPLLTGV